MKDGLRSRPKKLEKISFEEVMGAAGMSGFGALLERGPGVAEFGWQPSAESRLKFLLRGAALAENLGRQNDVLRSLNERLARRVKSLAQALGLMSSMTRTIPAGQPLQEITRSPYLLSAVNSKHLNGLRPS